MARPPKEGVEYFPLDVDFFQDKKIRLLKAEFGARGLMIVLAAFCRIYSNNGYYCSLDGDDMLLMADEIGCGVDPGLIAEVVQGCVKRSLFDGRVLTVFGVLTSAGIQRRYLRAVAKRDDIRIIREYWLLNENDPKDVPASMRVKVNLVSLSGAETGVSSPGNPVDSGKNTIKESKVYTPPTPSRKNDGNEETDEEPKDPQGWARVVSAYEANIYPVLPRGKALEALISYCEDLGADVVCAAIEATNLAQPDAPRPYLSRLLAAWAERGVNTLSAAQAEMRLHRQRGLQRRQSEQNEPPVKFFRHQNDGGDAR